MANKSKGGNEAKVFTLKRPQFKALASPSLLVKYHCPFHFIRCTHTRFTPRSESYVSWVYHVCSCYLSPLGIFGMLAPPPLEILLSGLEKPVGSAASRGSAVHSPQSTVHTHSPSMQLDTWCWHSIHLETRIWILLHKENRYPYSVKLIIMKVLSHAG